MCLQVGSILSSWPSRNLSRQTTHSVTSNSLTFSSFCEYVIVGIISLYWLTINYCFLICSRCCILASSTANCSMSIPTSLGLIALGTSASPPLCARLDMAPLYLTNWQQHIQQRQQIAERKAIVNIYASKENLYSVSFEYLLITISKGTPDYYFIILVCMVSSTGSFNTYLFHSSVLAAGLCYNL